MMRPPRPRTFRGFLDRVLDCMICTRSWPTEPFDLQEHLRQQPDIQFRPPILSHLGLEPVDPPTLSQWEEHQQEVERQRQQQQQWEEQQREVERQRQQQQQQEEEEENKLIDPQVWSIDLEKHSCGEFSHAVVQSRFVRRCYSQVEVGSNALFVGIYDGHNGHQTAEYLSDHLFDNLFTKMNRMEGITIEALSHAIEATDEEFLDHVEIVQEAEPMLVITGSSCVVGVIWKTQIFSANVGMSEAVTGQIKRVTGKEIRPGFITAKHDVDIVFMRDQIVKEHPWDPHFVTYCRKEKKYKVKGVSQACKTIGDAYLKRMHIEIPESIKNLRLSSPFIDGGISSKPFTKAKEIKDNKKLYIFASPGFWDLIPKKDAVIMAGTTPREGIASRLLRTAVRKAARKAETKYSKVIGLSRETRLLFHDDMSVIVVYIDHDLLGVKNCNLEQKSFKGFCNEVGASRFREIDDAMFSVERPFQLEELPWREDEVGPSRLVIYDIENGYNTPYNT